ncbi:MAG: Gfo/Idh/MocA family oxidoreductase [Verrucomicrobia bacterium]|nr:Gfo/Idh/MocA family oxidoreductase [Verrucomicrobiota bacterium]
MNNQPVRFAVVGLGMGHVRAQQIKKAAGAELTAVCDVNGERLKKATAEFGCAGHTDYAEMLKRPDVDAVMVVTPSGTHADFAIKAAQAGKHVIVTKPMEVTPDRCAGMIAAARGAGVVLAVDFESRYNPDYIQLKRWITGGVFGAPILCEARCKWWRTQEYYDAGGWRGTWKMDGGGALANQSVHLLDLMLWFMGKPVQVYAQTATAAHRMETEDLGLAIVRFENGARGVVVGTTTYAAADQFGIEFNGALGSVSTVYGAPMKFKLADGSQPTVAGEPHPSNTIEDFIAALREGRSPLVDGNEGKRSVDFLAAIYRSAREGVPVHL